MTILQRAKKVLKRFYPPPVDVFNREIRKLSDAVAEADEKISAKVTDLSDSVAQRVQDITKEQTQTAETLAALHHCTAQQKDEIVAELHSQIDRQKQEIMAELQKQFSLHEAKLSEQNTLINQVNRQSVISSRNASEAVWAEIFDNAITGSEWLADTAFSPGRWAVGYPYLYVMYRVLNEVHPRNILELGLGQSTRMIAQYAACCKARHQIVEHDPEWIEFFARSFKLPPCSSIVTLDRELVPYKEAEAVRVFKDFSKTFAGQRFDFISIDAPLGGDMKQYARIDVLQLLPDCLAEDFVIMLDDCERPGEQHTWKEMEHALDSHGVKYATGVYSGKKDCWIMSSESLKFVCSM